MYMHTENVHSEEAKLHLTETQAGPQRWKQSVAQPLAPSLKAARGRRVHLPA